MFKFVKLKNKIQNLFGKKIDEETLESLEQLFYEADLGTELSEELTDCVRRLYKKNSSISTDEILDEMQKKILADLPDFSISPQAQEKPHVILIVGVNGNGKTTSIAKLTKYYQNQGKSVLIGAADTFRAAALDQLEKWAERLGVDLVRGKPGSDPAAVVFDAIQAGINRGSDIVLIDTAGRLHTKSDLMQELEKIHRVSAKALPLAPHETLLVLDATIGQNGIEQAKIFLNYIPLTGLILTKLDGTAKGGTALSIQKKLNIPIHYLGTGERVEDLKPFHPSTFVKSIFE